ncbi:CaiB/BaiF CoA transferase family protein [Microbacterium aurum]
MNVQAETEMVNQMKANAQAVASGPLTGIRVLDLTSTMSGPYCTLLLAQLGAQVDKIEPPAGDVLRRASSGEPTEMSALFLSFNAGKRSISMDLRDSATLEVLKRAFAGYDVVVHNMRRSAAHRVGLTADALAAAGSEAILCEIVGYGPGPMEDRPAYDDTIQAASGMAWVQGNGSGPEYVRTAIADKTAGLYAALAVCAALRGALAGARVREVKIPMLETMAAFTTLEQMGGMTFDPPRGPALYSRTSSPDRKPYATADGLISVMIYTDGHWRDFLAEIGRIELLDDARFATLGGRTANIDEVYAFVSEQLSHRTTESWLRTFCELDVPASKLNSLSDIFEDEQLQAVEMFPRREHPTEGTIRTARAPFLFDGRTLPFLGFAESLGQSTQDFIQEHST